MPALAFALALNRIFDGIGRPTFGWLSDQIGRENTMAIAFSIGAGRAVYAQPVGHQPGAVRADHCAVLRCLRRDLQSFPATQGDTFGAKFAAANAGMLYTAKGAGALLVPIAAGIAKSHGWGSVFAIAMTFNVIAALLALVRAQAHARAAFCQGAAGAQRSPRRRDTNHLTARSGIT